MQDKFLQQVADYYLKKDISLAKYTFVFPNRRSASFMRKYMQRAIDSDVSRNGKPQFMPRMVSITYFIQQFDRSALAKTDELIFILYRAYCSLFDSPELAPDFDRFYFWGQMILADFEDVDSYMVNASQLYRNLKGQKEIRSNYLNAEQMEVIRYLWGDDAVPKLSEDFWMHMTHGIDDADSAAGKFVELWRNLGELYRRFIKMLDSMPTPLAYSGLQARRAYKTVKDMDADDFGDRRFVFVGFNVLSTSRMLIFERLRDLGIADFFWDDASPFFHSASGVATSSTRFIKPLAKHFKMPADFTLAPITSYPKIEILAVPSDFGQSKVTADILQKWAESVSANGQPISDDLLIDTAVVMADNKLLTPMLHAIPKQIDAVNVTMGITYASTPFAALMSSIISLHLRARQRKGVFYYFYQDVLDIISHPHISLVDADAAVSLKDFILNKHIYNISAQEIADKYPSFAFIFRQIDDLRNISEIRSYIDGVISTLTDVLTARTAANDKTKYYELSILNGYADAVKRLCALTETYGITLHERTFLQMIERALNLTPQTFTGEPLRGLQIMGINDTRCLDFSRLILTSMNERVFPQRNFTPSFIPMNLRAAYGLPTQEHEESANAYQFYRLLSRAEKVYLLYDSRTMALSSGEMSRFISQLVHLNKDAHVQLRSVDFPAVSIAPKEITIHKTEQVQRELQEFFPGGNLKVSASALKTYLSCPLRFYLQFVKGLRADDPVVEYIDASSYGTVIHALVQHLYQPYMGCLIDEKVLDTMLHTDLEHLALVMLNQKYYNDRYAHDLSRIPGEGQVIARIIALYVRSMLKAERRLVPYTFVGAEVGEHTWYEWRLNDKYTINFTMAIDRIDRLDADTLRFIDYKTGSDALSASSLDAILDEHNLGGVFQVLLYCYAYSAKMGFDGSIKPLIYKFQTIPKYGIEDIVYGKEKEKRPIDDYRQVEGFYDRFLQLIDRIFETEDQYPFVQTQNTKNCEYCTFAQLCGRVIDTK